MKFAVVATFALITTALVGALLTNGDPSPYKHTPTTQTSNPRSQPKPELVKTTEIVRAYADNEVAADFRFEGKTFRITGVIEKIGKELLGRPYVMLVGGSGALSGLQCLMPREKEMSVAVYHPGDHITLKGKITGKLMFVMAEECTVD